MTTWKSGSSIAFELDIVLSSICEYAAGVSLPPEFGDFLRSIPDDLNNTIREMLHGLQGFFSLMEFAAWLSGTQFEEEYGRATLPLRDLTAPAALDRLSAEAAPYGIQPDAGLPTEEALVDLGVRLHLALYQSVNLQVAPAFAYQERIRREFAASVAILSGGKNHRKFWRCLDRLFFEFYAPWREKRLARVEEQRALLSAAAGTPSGSGLLDLDWLPDQNPLWFQAGLREAVLAGSVNIFFVLEPFGIADAFELYPGWLLLTLATPGALYENFRDFAVNVASRANALADPTRLVILRLIRHFGMVNTEIARYLGISRPTVSVHARILREAGLIESEQVGREMRHRIVPSAVRSLFRDLDRLLDLPPEETALTPGQPREKA